MGLLCVVYEFIGGYAFEIFHFISTKNNSEMRSVVHIPFPFHFWRVILKVSDEDTPENGEIFIII